ncbi:hypothetical protein [Streptomyces sp. Z26]|uniref:hypothetical protein n=1 Tax=Streptomyces sp. Z26 TaxID=2500177 RepID=UPI0026BF6D14
MRAPSFRAGPPRAGSLRARVPGGPYGDRHRRPHDPRAAAYGPAPSGGPYGPGAADSRTPYARSAPAEPRGGRRARRAAALAGALAALGLLGVAAAGPALADGPDDFTIEDPRITESSGLAASRAHPGVYWTHNDSEDGPYVYAVDSRSGKTVATVSLRGIMPRDVEGISLGPDGDLYVGDIGDNLGGRWSEVWIYRFPEPKKLRDTTLTPTRYTVRYADGPRDAESLMVHPKTGRVYVASKNREGKGGVYAGPEKLSTFGVNTFRRVGDTEIWATDGAFSPDGTRLILRTYMGAEMYRWTAEGRPKPIDTVRVPMQRQGESVTFTLDGRYLMFGSEGEASDVEPVELEDEVLSEQAAKAKAADEKRGGGDADGESAGDNGDLAVGAATLAAAYLAWTGLRRLFGRRD